MNKFKLDPYKVLKSLLELTSAHLGKKFLKVMCDELKVLFSAEHVLVTEAIDSNPTTKVKILYSTENSSPSDFELEGTPCKFVYEDKVIQITKDLNITFEQMKDTTYESFYGIPIHDKEIIVLDILLYFQIIKEKSPRKLKI